MIGTMRSWLAALPVLFALGGMAGAQGLDLAATTASGAFPIGAGGSAFPLDTPSRAGLVICSRDCDAPRAGPSLSFTVSGSPEDQASVDVYEFTPRIEVAPEPDTTLGATVSAFGFDVGGAYVASGNRDPDALSFGAGFGDAALSFGGSLSFDIDDGRRESAPAARFGVGYAPRPGLTLDGGVMLRESGETERDVSAGVRMRLDF